MPQFKDVLWQRLNVLIGEALLFDGQRLMLKFYKKKRKVANLMLAAFKLQRMT